MFADLRCCFVLFCQEYLKKFGYLDDDAKTDLQMPKMRSNPGVPEFMVAVRTFQEFHGLNVTGNC